MTKLLRQAPEVPIAGFAFLTNFVWEMLQVPWFTGMSIASHGRVVWVCVQATGGDILILLGAFWLSSIVMRRRDWLITGELRPVALVVGTGVAVTVFIEALATGPLDRWQYAEAMPVIPIIGTGLAPLLQWLLLPPLVLWLSRRHLLGGTAAGPVSGESGKNRNAARPLDSVADYRGYDK